MSSAETPRPEQAVAAVIALLAERGWLTPALVIDLAAVRSNIRTTMAMVGADKWRPHVKTAKIPEVFDAYLAAGVRRFKCATPREARLLLERGGAAGVAVDVLVAIAHRGANLERIQALAERAGGGHRVHVLSEDPEHAADAAARGLGVFVDVDPGYGRSGIPMDALDRVRATVAAAGDGLAGMQVYDGHITDPDPVARAASCDALYPIAATLAEEVLPVDAELLTSGTPTFAIATGHPALVDHPNHRVGPGTVVYWDKRSEDLGIDAPYRFAAWVLGRVIARTTDQRFTVDAGSKAIDAAVARAVATPLDPSSGALRQGWLARRPSEEHLPFDAPGGDAPELGTLIPLVPEHVCPTVNLAEQAILVDGGDVRVVAVAGRSHELTPDP